MLRDRFERTLAGWVSLAARRPVAVLALAGVLTVASLAGAALHLGIVSETDELFDRSLPFRERRAAFHEAFPRLEDRVLVVVDAPSVRRARDAADALAALLSAEPEHFDDVFVPGGGPFFERHGLLYLDLDELEEVVDGLATAQPFLAELSRDPSLRGLFDVLSRALEQEVPSGSLELTPVLERVEQAARGARRLRAVPTAFDEVVVGAGPDGPGRRFVIVRPVRDFSDFVPARVGMSRLRELADELEAGTPELRVRLTGDLALQFEELESVRSQASVAGIASFLMVSIILLLALRSLRMIVAAVVTLLVGLAWTAGLAAVTVGHLNVISVAFAVLFIGLGVDFGIHFCLGYGERRGAGEGHDAALGATAATVGVGVAICSATTAIGFFSFVPTGYRGVSELGVIAGMGMFVSLVATLTVLPACLSLGSAPLRSAPEPLRVPLPQLPSRRPRAVVAAALVLAALGALSASRWHFDPNPLRVRDPGTEGVQTFTELLAEGDLHPWSAEILAADAASAEVLAARLRELPSVDRVVSLGSYVPDDQQEKLALLEEATAFLHLAGPGEQRPAPTRDEVVASLERFRRALEGARRDATSGDLATVAGMLAGEIDALLEETRDAAAGEAAVRALHESLVAPVLARLRDLAAALGAGEVAVGDLPPALRARMLAPDGRARVQVFARGDLNRNDELTRFYDEIREIAPDATGTSIYMVESARLIGRALVEAFSYAVALITLLLLAVWRNVPDTLRVLAPLLLAALLTAGSAASVGLSLNFANVIVLPLLLGIGVDTGIHLVHRARREGSGGLLDSSTSRAVFWSALTTIASFGALAFTPHRGMASLGQLLVLGVSLTLVANLLLVPALLALSRARSR